MACRRTGHDDSGFAGTRPECASIHELPQSVPSINNSVVQGAARCLGAAGSQPGFGDPGVGLQSELSSGDLGDAATRARPA